MLFRFFFGITSAFKEKNQFSKLVTHKKSSVTLSRDNCETFLCCLLIIYTMNNAKALFKYFPYLIPLGLREKRSINRVTRTTNK